MISFADISNSPSYWIDTLMNQATTSPESQTVSISATVYLMIKSELTVVLCLVVVFVVLFSSLLLDAVFSNPEWSCHPADSGHVGGLWRNHLLFALPLAGQKHLLTVPPHDHVPEVESLFFSVWGVTRIFLFVCWNVFDLPSRLPNPIYLGTLIAGMFHSLLCFYWKIVPNILSNHFLW